MVKSRRGQRNELGSLFAASIVIVAGAVVCSILFMAGDPEGSPWLIAMIVGVAVLFMTAIIGIRFPRIRFGLGFWSVFFGDRSRGGDELDYQPRRVHTGQHQPSVNPRPITADEARDIHLLSTSTWVPSRLRAQKIRDRERQQ